MATQISPPGAATRAQEADSVGASAAQRRPSGLSGSRARILTVAGYLVLQALQLLVLHRLAPRFFWLDDSQAQFGPMTWWMGQHLDGLRPPLMDPDLGQAGNMVADMQYGALDPLHWALQALSTLTDDFLRMSWVFAGSCVVLLGLGVLTLLRRYGVHPALAIAGALGTASSGFFLWYGSSWWPLLWSVAWLPWFWWGMAARRWPGVPVLVLATWALLTAGNPYVLFFALAIVVGQVIERVRAARSLRGLLRGQELARLVAMVGGLAMALPTLLATVQLSPYMYREGAHPLIGNAGFAVPNLADVVIGGPTLIGETNAWGGALQLVPAMSTFVLALPALAMVDWRPAIRSPGVLTAGAVCALAVVFTQLPTTVSVFRYPIRYIVVLQVALPVLALLAVTAAPLLSRTRVRLALVLVLVQGALASFRAPVFLGWHVLSTVMVAVALVGLLVSLRPGRTVTALAGAATVVLISALPVLIGERMMVALQDRSDELAGVPSPDDSPYRSLPAGRELGTTEADYRAHSAGTDEVATVITASFGADMGWAQGVLRGNGNLIAGFATGGGSLAVWQAHLHEHWCRTYQGTTCADAESLLAVAPGTATAWVDLLSADTVLLGDVPDEVRAHFDATWERAASRGDYDEYRRTDDLPGRVTAAQGVIVDQAPGGSRLAYRQEAMDTYTVTTGPSGGWMAFRIPFWPGLEATIDGAQIDVGTVDGAVLSLDLPAGLADATLEISYVPVGERVLIPSFIAGAFFGIAALVVWVSAARRRDRRLTPSTDGEPTPAGPVVP